jgi:hypothetical protein
MDSRGRQIPLLNGHDSDDQIWLADCRIGLLGWPSTSLTRRIASDPLPWPLVVNDGVAKNGTGMATALGVNAGAAKGGTGTGTGNGTTNNTARTIGPSANPGYHATINR